MPTDDKTQYGPVFAELFRESRLAPLGPGTPNEAALPRLREMTLERAFDHVRVVDDDRAECCLAGMWLYHDFPDESHRISQEINTPDGSYWHAIMHRREPDFKNSKYWFRRVGTHPVFEPLQNAAKELVGAEADLGVALPQSAWDPFAFVDLCESCITGWTNAAMTKAIILCQHIGQREWELLFDSCYRQAIGK